jgi:hypothetical protein
MTKNAFSTRLDGNWKVHRQQIELNTGIRDHLKRHGKVGEQFEVRTEAVISGTRHRAHPNCRGLGPACDFVKVKCDAFQGTQLSPLFHPDDNLEHPAKLVAIFRQIPTTDIAASFEATAPDDCFVLAHCADCQLSMLTRSWLCEVTRTKKLKHSNIGTVKHPYLVGHVFGVEEMPGFHAECDSEEKRQFITVSDVRTDWPNVFVQGSGEQKGKNAIAGEMVQDVVKSVAAIPQSNMSIAAVKRDRRGSTQNELHSKSRSDACRRHRKLTKQTVWNQSLQNICFEPKFLLQKPIQTVCFRKQLK